MLSADSSLKNRAYAYLGYRGIPKDIDTDILLDEAFLRLEKISRFVYRYEVFESLFPKFLNKEPYVSYLKGASGVIVSAMTIGHDADREIKLLSRTNPTMSVVLDACASAYLEKKSDDFEAALPYPLSYRFCPGYGGSSIADLRYIFDILKPEKFGITLSENNYMLPSKSMAGVIAIK